MNSPTTRLTAPKISGCSAHLFTDPDFLKPQRTTAQVTEILAAQIAEVAKSLQSRESVELADAKTRAEINVAQRKNLRIARFLNRIVFCLFAEDTGLLPTKLFTEIARLGLDDPQLFRRTVEELFRVMAKGGTFGNHKIRHFNGHLFEEATVFELTEKEMQQARRRRARRTGSSSNPASWARLFERALEPEQRSQLGAHYTSEADIKTLVEPVLMAPLRREWAVLKGELAAAFVKGKGTAAQRDRLAKFQKKLAAVTVLDPACGSGNFLYVSLQLLLGLEKEVITFATQLGFAFKPQVSVQQLKAIEINPYAFELAQVSVQIGYLQWRRDNGFDNDRTPVLQVLDGFQNEDALLVPHFRSKAKTLEGSASGRTRGRRCFEILHRTRMAGMRRDREQSAISGRQGNAARTWSTATLTNCADSTAAESPANPTSAAIGLRRHGSKSRAANASAWVYSQRRGSEMGQTAKF